MKLGVCVLCRWAVFHALGQRVIISSCQECQEFPLLSSFDCESKEAVPTHVTALHRITSLADCGNGLHTMKTKLQPEFHSLSWKLQYEFVFATLDLHIAIPRAILFLCNVIYQKDSCQSNISILESLHSSCLLW